MILSVGTGCAGSILRRGQEKGVARSGTTGKRFDEPAAAKDPGPLGCALVGARGVAPLGRCPTSSFARFVARKPLPARPAGLARLADRRTKSVTQPIPTDKIML
ncbi:MAG: hypothetical protein WAN51_12420 [Alphaproteobacteria bacterium]